jgi:tetratricopeptide (TPR) repeat protein
MIASILPLLALGATAAEESADPCAAACGVEFTCLQEQAGCLVAEERGREALDRLKAACSEAPDDGALLRLLAWAYLEQGNSVWAIRKLSDRVSAAPDDAESRSWAAWVLMQEGDLTRARQLIDQAPPSPEPWLEARLQLIDAALLQLEDRLEPAKEQLATLREAPELAEEDRAMLASLRSQLLGDRGEPISARVQLSGGYASNVIESAPQDVGSGKASSRQPQAPIAALDAVLRYEPWGNPSGRPVAELRAKGFSPFSADAAGFAYLTTGARLGAELGPATGERGRILYSAELMGLRGDPEPASLAEEVDVVAGGWIMEAHRGDLELDIGSGAQLFAGGGRRIYSELHRSRWELDGGGARVQPLGGGWNLTGVATGRYQQAEHPGWDTWGLTGLARLAAPLPGGHMLKARGMVLYDVWPDFGLWENTEPSRSDVALRLQVGPWSRSFSGWRLGLTYNLAQRSSTVDAYSYTDHRALLEIRWQQAWDPSQPRAASIERHLVLPYGLDDGGESGLDRVQDLLRQEDSARRGSSCVD